MPVFPGQMRYVRKNLYHAVYVIDPATPKGMMVSVYPLILYVPCDLKHSHFM